MSAQSAAALARWIMLPERRLVAARATWIVALLLAAVLFVAGLPVITPELRSPCAGRSCHYWQLSPQDAAEFARLGFSRDVHVIYQLAADTLLLGGFSLIAAIIALHRPDEPMALLVAFALVTFGSSFSSLIRAAAVSSPLWYWPRETLACLGWTSLFLCFYLFPDGRFIPRWTRFAAAVWFALMILNYFSPARWGLNTGAPAESGTTPSIGLFGDVMPLFFVSVAIAQVYRYRRVSTPVQRQQTKWVILGFIAAVGGFIALVADAPAVIFGSSNPIVSQLLGLFLFVAVLLLLPVSLALAILRYRLWDIDLIINRALVYGGLTAGVVLLYVLVVGYLGVVFRTGGNLAISLVATALVAVLFQPARERLQRGVNRLMYGEQDDPYGVLSRLGLRLEGTLAVHDVLPMVVETLTQALKLPYAAIAIAQDSAFIMAASLGSPTDNVLTFPLSYRGETVGKLMVGPRIGERSLSAADRRLLEDLARQAGAAAYSVRLTAELQRSRERLVTLREEERRRVRRDLHDGLGPALAGVMLKINTARRLLDPQSPADPVLVEARADMQASIAGIRRLVYDLRPPALDELGLLGALREGVVEFEGDGRHVVITSVDPLPPLPAAVDVAAYRIVQEALTNVVRHAQAHLCTVQLTVRDGLDVEVTDDGVGLPGARHIGVGLTSMRERAAELGGTCSVEPAPGGGTRVRAHLPLPRG